MGFAAPQGESRDIDAEFAQRGTNLANYAGLVAIPQIKEGAFELRFDRNTADLQHAGSAVVQDGALSGEFRRGIRSFALFWQRGNFECIREAVLTPASLLFDRQSPRAGNLW